MSLKDRMEQALRDSFEPESLNIVDESHLHEGHGGWREGGQTHFRIDMKAQAFSGKSRLACHRMVNEALSFAFAEGLHALAIKARGPGEG